MNIQLNPSPDGESASEPRNASGFRVLAEMGLVGPTVIGLSIIGVFFGVFVGWAALAPLGSAAIAPGIVSVESNRKTIQHLEGGIVSEILVKDGDIVSAGQVLIVLDATQVRASLALVRGRELASQALESRLTAEREERTEIVFSPRLLANKTEPVIVEAIKGQRSIFTARRKALAGQVSILNQQSAQILEEIKGLQGQIISEKEQQRLIADEISDISSLVEMGLAPRPRLRKLERESAEIDGRLSQNAARIAQAKQAIAGTRLKASELKTAQANEVVQELRAVQTELFDLAERRRATEDVMARTTVRAPIAGTIVNLLVHTRGGVITPGAPLMDIVPSADLLVVEARVSPNDIDIVHIGLPAQVRFSAFSQRSTQPVDGIVTALSADSLTDENTGETYYLARVKIKDDLTEKLGGAELYPGMQAEVMIVTGERTALEYFFKPLTSSLNRAFREQ